MNCVLSVTKCTGTCVPSGPVLFPNTMSSIFTRIASQAHSKDPDASAVSVMSSTKPMFKQRVCPFVYCGGAFISIEPCVSSKCRAWSWMSPLSGSRGWRYAGGTSLLFPQRLHFHLAPLSKNVTKGLMYPKHDEQRIGAMGEKSMKGTGG